MIKMAPISVTLQAQPNLKDVWFAWAYSRPNEGDLDFNQIARTDVPVHEFARMVFTMEVPILLREWIASFRDHVMWARTSRVDDLTKWNVHFTAAPHIQEIEALYADMMKARETSHQDHFRSRLPLSYMTGLSLSLSYRSWIKMLKAAKHAASIAQNAGVRTIFEEFHDKLIVAGCAALPEEDMPVDYVQASYNGFALEYPLAEKFHVSSPSELGTDGYFIANLQDIPLNLRAQLVRHRPLMIKDSLQQILDHERCLAMPISTPMDLSFACTEEVAKRIAKKRNCWIAQEDLWAPVIRAINRTYSAGPGGEPPLPCSGGQCTATRDNQLRKEGKDPAPPCPRYANLHGEAFTIEQDQAALDYLKLRPLTENFWFGEINAVPVKIKDPTDA